MYDKVFQCEQRHLAHKLATDFRVIRQQIYVKESLKNQK